MCNTLKTTKVVYKSTDENWQKEVSGKKPCTLRDLSEPNDMRPEQLRSGRAKVIVLVNKETNQRAEFNITDFTEYKGWGIISFDSWKELAREDKELYLDMCGV